MNAHSKPHAGRGVMIGTLWPYTLETSPAAIGAALARAVRLEDEAAWARFEAAHPELVGGPTTILVVTAGPAIPQQRGVFR